MTSFWHVMWCPAWLWTSGLDVAAWTILLGSLVKPSSWAESPARLWLGSVAGLVVLGLFYSRASKPLGLIGLCLRF
ncbi:hypothetical protein LIER_31393 [Lithospermum erythrorhizon]|uniref:Uncharacterized protein n=1 Tax=Lithospermum erythrorhizon TaxID=34254 RepID=A0AAV3RUM8_LITER